MSIPFFGFGFADNFIMIICGDSIDAHFGARLGLTTMAAAGLGNWVSDCVGLGLGDFIESIVARLGLSDGKLTLAQQKLRITKLVSLSPSSWESPLVASLAWFRCCSSRHTSWSSTVRI